MPSISRSPASDSPWSDRRVLWLGGAQWAGKTTVATLLCARYPMIRYAYDYHDGRSHSDRARADPARYPHMYSLVMATENDPDSHWVRPEPYERAQRARGVWEDRFPMVLDDLAAMPRGVTVLAEGWGLRPELVAPLIESPRQAIFLVPTEAFRQHQLATLPRAQRFFLPNVSDPERAQRNRVERDRLLAEDVVEQAERLGLRVVHADGGSGPDQMVALVEEHFKPFLPAWIY